MLTALAALPDLQPVRRCSSEARGEYMVMP